MSVLLYNLPENLKYDTYGDIDKKLEKKILKDFKKYPVNTQELWAKYLKKYPTWNMLVFLYINFIKGKIQESPVHFAPLSIDVQNLGVQELIMMNELGFITVDSQPGVYEETIYKSELIKTKQRQYVIGYMLKDKAHKFIENLQKVNDSKLYYQVIDHDNNFIYKYQPNITEDSFPVTMAKSETETEWEDETWIHLKNFAYFLTDEGYGPFYLSYSYEDLTDLHKWIIDNTFYVQLFYNDFCKPNVMNETIIMSLIS